MSFDFQRVTTGAGAYVIATDRPLNRAIGSDEDGILDVGESMHLRQRLRRFRRCAMNRLKKGHMAGRRYASLRLERHFPLDSLRVRWTAAESKDDANRIEGIVMLRYLQRHGELPPLNYSFNRNKGVDLSAV